MHPLPLFSSKAQKPNKTETWIKIIQKPYLFIFEFSLFWKFWHFPPIFVQLKMTCLVTLFDRKLQVFKNSPNWTIFGIFNKLLATHNVNVARLNETFSVIFRHSEQRRITKQVWWPLLIISILSVFWQITYDNSSMNHYSISKSSKKQLT